MRKLLAALPLTLALGALLVPTALASGPADHTLPPDASFEDVNPCTGELTTVTQSYRTAAFHETVDSSGAHFTFTGAGAITTTDGFSGRFSESGGANFVAGGDVAVETFRFSATLRNGSGQLVNATFVVHITVVDGTPVAEVELDSVECRGKPS
jgi:hypothetical protein